MTSTAKTKKRDAILGAANMQFKLYGYQKTSMENIANSLGISRASLYSYFENKDEIFRQVSIEIHESALTDAKQCLNDKGADADLASKIEGALRARHLPFHRRVTESIHGAELYDEYSRLCGDIVADSFHRFQTMLAAALKSSVRRKEIELKAFGLSAAGAAELLNLASVGLKRDAETIGVFEKRLHSFVLVFVTGLQRPFSGQEKREGEPQE